ncbi:MAG: DUF5050 domain-containing protein, partial [Oscillospiraceae bacterium]|nr:DUF5050 domain-containing protein [Oscillospiraceae bacterium]
MMKHKRAAVVALALCLFLLSLAGCGTAKVKLYLPKTADCAYAAGVYEPEANTKNMNRATENTYGNAPYATLTGNRRAVAAPDGTLYSAINAEQALQKIVPGGEAALLYDGCWVGQVSYYDRYVYFSDYVPITEPKIQGKFYAQRLYRIRTDASAEGAELLYEAKNEMDCFDSFQLCNGYLYLIGSRAFSTFGVRRYNPEGKTEGALSATLLGDQKVENVQVSGSHVYYILRGGLYEASLRGVERRLLLEAEDVRAFCVVENNLYFTRKETPGVFVMPLTKAENAAYHSAAPFLETGDVESFFALDGTGEPDCFVLESEDASALQRQLVRRAQSGPQAVLAEDVMPA